MPRRGRWPGRCCSRARRRGGCRRRRVARGEGDDVLVQAAVVAAAAVRGADVDALDPPEHAVAPVAPLAASASASPRPRRRPRRRRRGRASRSASSAAMPARSVGEVEVARFGLARHGAREVDQHVGVVGRARPQARRATAALGREAPPCRRGSGRRPRARALAHRRLPILRVDEERVAHALRDARGRARSRAGRDAAASCRPAPPASPRSSSMRAELEHHADRRGRRSAATKAGPIRPLTSAASLPRRRLGAHDVGPPLLRQARVDAASRRRSAAPGRRRAGRGRSADRCSTASSAAPACSRPQAAQDAVRPHRRPAAVLQAVRMAVLAAGQRAVDRLAAALVLEALHGGEEARRRRPRRARGGLSTSSSRS